MNSETKQCQNCKQDFTIEAEDFEFYKKIEVPPPTFCPGCRFQRRLAYRNERNLYRNKSAKSGQEILALYAPESGVTVYEEKEWWADDWDSLNYGRDYNFSKTFFEQFFDLAKVAPRFNRSVTSMVNSDYSANAGYLKNCYLLFNSNHSEDCAYGNGADNSKDCFDISHVNKCERCYNCFWLTNCYQCFFSIQCEDSQNLWFSKNCKGCQDCFGCVNLRNQKYHIFNQPHTKEDYFKKLEELNLENFGKFQKAKEEAEKFWLRFPNKYIQGINNVNSSGEYITNSKNVRHSYLVREGEDLKYVQYLQVPTNKNCYDITIWGEGNELGYENCVTGMGAYNSRFCVDLWPNVKNSEYSMFCTSCSEIFGCVGLRNKQYCILNKQYSKEEYFDLLKKIKEHMNSMPYTDKKGCVYKYGEFFPAELSPHSYNQSVANEHFPLDKTKVLSQGYTWHDASPKEYEITLEASRISDLISDIGEKILAEVIKCQNCSRAYRILVSELNFLKKHKLPIPRQCVNCRHAERISWRNSFKLYKKKCFCGGEKSLNTAYQNTAKHSHDTEPCPNEFETSYSPDRPEIVYCENCYNSEVV